MELSTICSFVTGGLGFLSAFKKRSLYSEQASSYERQAEINRQIGAFNARAADIKTAETIQTYALNTRNVMDQQLLSFSNRGISLEGSPMLMLGETMTMGSKQAQEAAFDIQVKKINYQFAAQSAIAEANAKREIADYGAKSATTDIITQTLQSWGLVKSAEATGKAPSIGLFGIKF